MRKRAIILGAVFVFIVGGCKPPATEDLLAITFGSGAGGSPVQLDVDCENGGCASIPLLTGQLTYEADVASTIQDQVEILQYRVDYKLQAPNDLVAIPYFAGDLSLLVLVGETMDFDVVVAGDNQREVVHNRVPDQSVRGTATLTLGGYDAQNEQVFPRADFKIYFGDFVDEANP